MNFPIYICRRLRDIHVWTSRFISVAVYVIFTYELPNLYLSPFTWYSRMNFPIYICRRLRDIHVWISQFISVAVYVIFTYELLNLYLSPFTWYSRMNFPIYICRRLRDIHVWTSRMYSIWIFDFEKIKFTDVTILLKICVRTYFRRPAYVDLHTSTCICLQKPTRLGDISRHNSVRTETDNASWHNTVKLRRNGINILF